MTSVKHYTSSNEISVVLCKKKGQVLKLQFPEENQLWVSVKGPVYYSIMALNDWHCALVT
jgi:hypothetical protein